MSPKARPEVSRASLTQLKPSKQRRSRAPSTTQVKKKPPLPKPATAVADKSLTQDEQLLGPGGGLEQTDVSQPTISQDSESELIYWRWLAWFGIGVIVILLSSALIILLNYSPTPEVATISYRAKRPAAETIAVPTVRAALTGQLITAAAAARRPWAVIIENFPTVRPQAGLAAADLVVESPTEGGITRFLTIFQSELPPGPVGPIRSARSFFNDWARPLAPLYSHSGGSEKALRQLQQGYGNIQDVNEFFNAEAYQRDLDKTLPHNLFTTAERFWNYAAEKKWDTTGKIPELKFKDNLIVGQLSQTITIPYQPSEYQVSYTYQPASGSYARATGGTTQFDSSTNTAPAIKNVIVLFTDIKPIPNDYLKRVDLRTSGSGKMLLFNNGQMAEGQWSKADADSFFKFQDNDGNDLALTPGKTWISVIDKSQYNSIQVSSAGLAP